MRPVTPRGFRDVLAAEAAERRVLSARIGNVFSSWGYELVETPVVEELAAVEAAAGPLGDSAFRLIDSDGRLLVLRPDMTVPIARMVATRLAGTPGPHRFSYDAQVFRELSQTNAFFEAGFEDLFCKNNDRDLYVRLPPCSRLSYSGRCPA